MADTNRLLELLELVGLRGYEARAYLALIEIGEASASVIASKAGIPQPRVYEVLDSLLKKGLVEVKIGRPRTYRALSPDVALNLYAKRYIDDVYLRIKRLIDELSKLYLSSVHEREPLIWINYSLDSGLEKAKKILADMRYDGFLSVSDSILDRLWVAIYERLRRDKHSILAVTIIGKDVEEKIIKQAMAINRAEIRRLPTGILQVLETDLSDVMLLTENYTMHSREWELVLIMNEIYYFGYWRLAETIKPVEVERGEKFITTHHWLAMDVALRALNDGYNVRTRIKGYRVGTRKPVVVEGYIKEIIRAPGDNVRTLVVETLSGEKVEVGGLGASIEDVEARLIELRVE